jgi:hypothetical protein
VTQKKLFLIATKKEYGQLNANIVRQSKSVSGCETYNPPLAE